MAFDEYGNDPELMERAQQSSAGYNPSQWNSASDALNSYNDAAKGGAIDWDKAKSIYEGFASSGQGNHGDWVNSTWDQRNKWTAQPSYTTPKASSANVTTAWTRQNVRDTLMRYGSGGMGTAADLARAIAENPWLGTQVSPGKIRDTQAGGTGRTWDVLADLADDGRGVWQTLTGNTARAAAAKGVSSSAPVAAAPRSAASIAAGPGASADAVGQTTQAIRSQLIEQLLGRAKQQLTGNPDTDAVIRAQSDAYAANEERSRREYLADTAEEVGPLGNIRGETRLSAERVGQRTGAYEADLRGRDVTARRTEVADALQMLTGLITVEEEMELRKELAQMDDEIKRLGLKQDNSQFNADLGYRNRALNQSGQQFNDTLGYNYDTFDWLRSPLNPNNFPT